MTIVLINPNSTEAMTNAMLETAQRACPERDFLALTSWDGPPAIQGEEDGARAVPHLLELVEAQSDADAIVIGCFDDTGLAEARARAHCPVIGIGQAAYHAATLRHGRFSVVTTLAVSIPVIEENIKNLGFGAHCGRVRASGVPVLELERDPEGSARAVLSEVQAAHSNDGVSSVVLGCAGMSEVAARLRDKSPVPLVDSVAAAARLAAAISG